MNRLILCTLAALAGSCELALSQSQPCNPVIDGTYCASQMPKAGGSSSDRSLSFGTIQNMGSDLMSASREDPVTFGAITFQGDGTRCIGLMRRGNCK